MYHPPGTPTMPLTEDQIERVVEKRTDTMDSEFMDGRMTREDYDANCKALSAWADREYARTRKVN